jgi:hypothetical protein
MSLHFSTFFHFSSLTWSSSRNYEVKPSRVSSVDVVIGYGSQDRGFGVPVPIMSIFSPPFPERSWSPPSFLCNCRGDCYPYLYPPETGSSSCTKQYRFLSINSRSSQGYRGGIRIHLHTGFYNPFNVTVICIPLYGFGSNCIENTASNIPSIAAIG